VLGLQEEDTDDDTDPLENRRGLDTGPPGAIFLLEWFEMHSKYLDDPDFTALNIRLAAYIEEKLRKFEESDSAGRSSSIDVTVEPEFSSCNEIDNDVSATFDLCCGVEGDKTQEETPENVCDWTS